MIEATHQEVVEWAKARAIVLISDEAWDQIVEERRKIAKILAEAADRLSAMKMLERAI